MNKKLIFGIIFLSLISLSFVSAGLCLGYDNYYHDCDDSRYYEYNRDYDDYYYKYGKEYPTRDYYYRDYYRPKRYSRNYDRYRRRNDIEIKYDDVEEYNRLVVYDYEDRYGSQKYKTTINTKTEINLDYDLPSYIIYPKYDGDYNKDRYDPKEDYKKDSYVKPIPWHYSQYKQYY
tara:strand:- start:575 stop:1099 length:525 start_codon:yes stop_codon:yes gene_type:complete